MSNVVDGLSSVMEIIFVMSTVVDGLGSNIKIATKLNRLCEEMLVIHEKRRNLMDELRLCEEMLVIHEKRRNLVDELRSIRGIVVVGKDAEFMSDTIRKDNAQIEQLREIESQMNDAANDFEFAKRISMLYQEMEMAYGEKLDFIRELEGVPGVAMVTKTAEFLNDKLWKDDKILTKLHNMKILACDCGYHKEEFVERL
nr:hypothetical protein [Tanacetum cinerariifolium]